MGLEGGICKHGDSAGFCTDCKIESLDDQLGHYRRTIDGLNRENRQLASKLRSAEGQIAALKGQLQGTQEAAAGYLSRLDSAERISQGRAEQRDDAIIKMHDALRRLSAVYRPLSKLAAATTHLLDDHDCDAHGHEEYRHAIQQAQAFLTAGPSAACAAEYVCGCGAAFATAAELRAHVEKCLAEDRALMRATAAEMALEERDGEGQIRKYICNCGEEFTSFEERSEHWRDRCSLFDREPPQWPES